MSIRGHGNWCGPGWSAGQWKDAKDLTLDDLSVPAVDELDQLCKEHDIAIWSASTREEIEHANQMFIFGAEELGIQGQVFAQLVSWFGPSEPGMSFHNFPNGAYTFTR